MAKAKTWALVNSLIFSWDILFVQDFLFSWYENVSHVFRSCVNWNKKIYYSGYFNSLEVDGTNINLVFSSVLLFFFPPVIREESHCQMLKRENIISKMTRNTKRDILIQEPTLLCLFYFFLPSNQGTNHVTSITCYIYYFICWMVMFMSTFLVHYTIYNLKWLNTWASCQGPRSL